MDASADGEFFLRDIGEDPTSTNHFPSDFRINMPINVLQMMVSYKVKFITIPRC